MMAARADMSIIRVPNDFPTIQGAINAATNGSTILVSNGTYTEQIDVNKTLTLEGADKENTIIFGAMTVTADNTVINGFTIRNSTDGIILDQCNGTVLSGNIVTLNSEGIVLDNSNSSIISGNIVTLNSFAGIEMDNSGNNTVSDNIISFTSYSLPGLVAGYGMELVASAKNTITDNFIISSVFGLSLEVGSDYNSIFGNTVEQNTGSIEFYESSNNTIFGNNFLGHPGAGYESVVSNVWSVGGRGNYWDDYTGLDDGSGGRVAGDGVGDTELPWHGVDYYPLISPMNPLQVFWDNKLFPVLVISNSTVSSFNFDQTDNELTFNVNGPANTTGFFNVSVPTALLSGSWTVLLNGTDVTSEAVISGNQTYTSIYLNYSLSSAQSVQVIGTDAVPEYAAGAVLPLLALVAVPLRVLATEKRKKKQTHSKNE